MREATTLPILPGNVSWMDRMAARAVLGRLATWNEGHLLVKLPDGSRVEFGDSSSAPLVAVEIRDWCFFRRVLAQGDVGVGDAYVDGLWDASDLAELCRLALVNGLELRSKGIRSVPGRIGYAVLRELRRNHLRRAAKNIRAHYDLGNDFYETFLDPSLTYSCAVFDTPGASLEEAQAAKIDAACRQIGLAPGHRVLEIGSGWGSFALHAAREYGCQVRSITLSEEQCRLARRRVAEAGLGDRVDVGICDYRNVEGRFDRVVSIEMLEAVGYEYFRAFFGKCAEVLEPGGRMFLQTITIPDQRFDAYRRDFDWIRKHIFPGGLLPSLFEISRTIKEVSELRISWLRDIGSHYTRTLAEWRRRFLAHLPEVRQLGFDERFVRMWEFYLASCEAGFASGFLGDLQLVLEQPR